jgi:hypothetical protein
MRDTQECQSSDAEEMLGLGGREGTKRSPDIAARAWVPRFENATKESQSLEVLPPWSPIITHLSPCFMRMSVQRPDDDFSLPSASL